MKLNEIIEKFKQYETFEKEKMNVYIEETDTGVKVYELGEGDEFAENSEISYDDPKSFIEFKKNSVEIFYGKYNYIENKNTGRAEIHVVKITHIDSNKSFIELSDVYKTGNLFALLVKMLMINAIEKLNVTGLKNSSDYIENAVRNINSYSSYYFRRFSKYGKDVPIPFGNDDCLEKFHNVIYDMEKTLEGKYYVSTFIRKFILYRIIEIFNIDVRNERYIGILDGNVLSSTALKYWELIKDDKSTAEELFNIAMITLHKQKWNGFMSEYKSFNKAFNIAVKKKRNTLKGMCYIIQNVEKNRIRDAFITIFSAMDRIVENGEI